MKKLILFASTAVIILSGCDKDQKSVRQLNGEWQVNEMTVNGTAVPREEFEGTKYTFEKCRLKKDGECEGNMSIIKIGAPEATPFKYNISEDGTKITIAQELPTGKEGEVGEIMEQTRKEVRFKLKDDRGNVSELALNKADE